MQISRRSWLIACVFLASGVASAQFGREAVWMTAGSNAQRSSWVRADASIARDNLASDFQFLWKVQLDKGGSGAPSEPILMDRYIGYRGFRSLAFMGDIGGGVYAVDTDLNRIEWQKHIVSADQPKSSSSCAGSLSASVTLPAIAGFPSALGAGGGFGRSGPAKSGVGEPLQGAVTLAAVAPVVPRPLAAAAVRAPGVAARARPPIVIYSVTSDGMFHALYVSNGEESEPAVKFVSASSTVRGLIVVDQVAYAVAGQNCGPADQVVALNLATKEVTTWNAGGAAIAGSEGASLGPDGTLYVATGKGDSSYASSVVALEAKTLKPKSWYSVPGQEFTSTPAIFQYKNKVFAAAAGKDGHVHILDTAAVGGPNHQTAIAVSYDSSGLKIFEPGAVAVWQDSKLIHWLLASAGTAKDGGVMAWKLVDDEHGVPVLESGWASRKIGSPTAPIVINGVAFTASGGREKSVVYALDAGTGQELWNSKGSIGSSVAALSAGAGRVYATTHDGALYAFGFPMEH